MTAPRQLPRALRGWAEPLALFDEGVARGLAPWLGPLAALIGPQAPAHAHDQGEPAGYDGLSQRGLYERLLISEWLLAEELPDEFLRRAASGEHMFLHLARSEPQVRTATVALFDVGPWQLGPPRLAQLALLVVLARRSAAAGGHFCFGAVQLPGTLWTFERAGIKALLAARTARTVTDGQLLAWRQALSAEQLGEAERWLVGEPSSAWSSAPSSEPARPFPNEQRVGIQLMPGDLERLTVTVPSGKQLTLPLPSESWAIRTLRHPWPSDAAPQLGQTAAHGHFDPTLYLSAQGRRLLLRDGHDVLALHVPGSSSEPPGHPKRARGSAEQPVLAACMYGRRLLWLAYAPARNVALLCDGSSNPIEVACTQPLAFSRRDDDDDDSSSSPRLLWLAVDAARGGYRAPGRHIRGAWLRDAADTLWRIDTPTDGPASISRLADDVQSQLWLQRGEIAYCYRNEHSVRVVSVSRGVDQYGADEVSAVRLSCEGRDKDQQLSYALRRHGRWQLRDSAGHFTDLPEPPPGWSLLGVLRDSISATMELGLGVVLVDKARRRFALLTSREEIPLFTISSGALAIHYAPARGRLAVRSHAGGVLVYCLFRREYLLRLSPDSSPQDAP